MPEPHETRHAGAGRVGNWLYRRVGGPAALLCMVALFAAGLGLSLYSLSVGISRVYVSGVRGAFQSSIGYLLEGIELVILAPLVYLVFASMATLVGSVRRRLKALNHLQDEEELARSRQHLDETFDVVHRVKQSIAGLLVALLITDLAGKVLNRESLTWMEIVAQLGALVICIAYYLVQATTGAHRHAVPEPAAPHRESAAAAK